MSSVYVDTNIFLNFYRGYGNSLDLISALQKLGKRLVLTQQTLNEFERNRAKALAQAIAALAVYDFKAVALPDGLMSAVDEFKELETSRASVKRSVKKLQEKLQKNIDDEMSDPVFVAFRNLQKSALLLDTTKENVDKAHERLLLGTPPLSRDKGTMGDQLIWETLLAGCTDDLVICSEDGTFALYEAFLRGEYQRKTGKKLIFVTELSEALKAAGADNTQAKKAEQEAAAKQKADEKERVEAYEEVQRALLHIIPKWGNVTMGDVVNATVVPNIESIGGNLKTLGNIESIGLDLNKLHSFQSVQVNLPLAKYLKSFEGLAGAVPLGSLEDLQRAIAASPVLKVAQGAQSAVAAIAESPAMKTNQRAQNAVTAIAESPAMKTVQQAQKPVAAIAESPTMKTIQQAQKAVTAIAESPAMKTVQQAQKAAAAISESPAIKAVQQAHKAVAAIAESPAVKAVQEVQRALNFAGEPAAQSSRALSGAGQRAPGARPRRKTKTPTAKRAKKHRR